MHHVTTEAAALMDEPLGRRSGARRPQLAPVALALVSIVASLVVLEVISRVTGILPHNYPAPGLFVEDPQLGYAMLPNYRGTYAKGRRRFFVHTNTQGFRDERDFGVHEPGASRILVVGDSFVFGMPVEREDTFVAYTERTMNRMDDGGGWQVLNAGVPGYGTRQEVRLLERWLPIAAPIAVVLGFCLDNDISDNRHPSEAPNHRAYHGALVTPDVVAQSDTLLFDSWNRMRLLLRSLVLYAAGETALLNLMAPASHPGTSYQALATETWPVDLQEGYRETQRAIEEMIRLMAAHRVPLAVLVFPSKTEISSTAPGDLSGPRRLIVQFLADRGVNVIDPTAALVAAGNRGDLFETNGTHLVEAGSAIVGEVAARALLSWLAPEIAGATGEPQTTPSVISVAPSRFPAGVGAASPAAAQH
jgi:hypothetical protein